jgi:hypothetical protein
MNSKQFQELQEAYMNVYQLDEISDELVGRSVNKRIQQTGAANNAETKDRTPENMQSSVRASKKEASMKTAAANRRERKAAQANEEVDIYDVILSHLIDEGYASTEEAATAIMVNMSEEWRDSVVEAYKELPVSKMIRKAGVKQFKHGMTVGSGASSNPKVAQQVGKMGAIASLHDPERAKAKSKFKKG